MTKPPIKPLHVGVPTRYIHEDGHLRPIVEFDDVPQLIASYLERMVNRFPDTSVGAAGRTPQHELRDQLVAALRAEARALRTAVI